MAKENCCLCVMYALISQLVRITTISATNHIGHDHIGHSLYNIGHNGNQYRPQTIGLYAYLTFFTLLF